MKKIILAVFVSVMVVSPVYADEEIQLAAVMVDTDSTPIVTNKKMYAALGGDGLGGRDEGITDYSIIAGITVAATLAIVASGADSTSNH